MSKKVNNKSCNSCPHLDKKYSEAILADIYICNENLNEMICRDDFYIKDINTPHWCPLVSSNHDIVLLRKTIGCSMWLDNLSDEQFDILEKEIIPFYEKAKEFRYCKYKPPVESRRRNK